MAEIYSYRRYKPGDEVAINELYFKVTGRRRTPAQYSWQWLEAPEGVGEIWLIEATDEHGNTKLIGHHGIMPLAFTNKETELLFGKTENTMVLPEYRKRFYIPDSNRSL
ncbi:GNAT family N-acetyltransferase [Oceanimonas sp. NS1]|nr:GNAT family N-acetyltransferase [Oceanimonas sp. NS1]